MGYDGTIAIDTRIDTKGMNKGTKSITAQLGGVLRAIKGVGAALGLAFSGAAVFSFIKKTLESFDLLSSSVGGQIKELKSAFDIFKGALASSLLTLFSVLVPYIIIAVNWLTKMLTTFTAIISALFGVEAAMAGVTDETKQANKAAKGQLAAFDQINVLSKNDNETGNAISAMAIPPSVLEGVEEFKNKMLAFLQPVIDALGRLYDALLPLGMTIWEGLKWAWENILVPLGEWVITDLLPNFLDLLAAAADVLNAALKALAPLWQVFFDEFLQPLAKWAGGKIIEFLDWLTMKLGELAVWINENPEKFQTFATILGVVALAVAALGVIAFLIINPLYLIVAAVLAVIAVIMNWESITTWYVETAKKVWTGFFDFLKGILEWYFGTASKIWGGIGEGIRNAFSTALDWVQEKFIIIFEGIKVFVRGIINDIIGFINGMIFGIVEGINGLVDGFNAVGSIVPGFSPASYVTAPQIPYLATGAVIPPNSEFMAVLGDQRNGRNIEAPEGLIRQIVSEEIGKITADITVNFAGSLSGLVRELKPYIDKENVRVGSSLIKSGATI